MENILKTLKQSEAVLKGVVTFPELDTMQKHLIGTTLEQLRVSIDELSNSHKHDVMQAEWSDGVHEAAVGNSAAGQSGSDGIMKWCDSCGKITYWLDGECENYRARGGSAKGALPF